MTENLPVAITLQVQSKIHVYIPSLFWLLLYACTCSGYVVSSERFQSSHLIMNRNYKYQMNNRNPEVLWVEKKRRRRSKQKCMGKWPYSYFLIHISHSVHIVPMMFIVIHLKRMRVCPLFSFKPDLCFMKNVKHQRAQIWALKCLKCFIYAVCDSAPEAPQLAWLC